MNADDVSFSLSPAVSNGELNALFASAWSHEPPHEQSEVEGRDFGPMLERSLAYACAHCAEQLVGFVNLAWDGGAHAFISEAVVHRDFQRRGIGSRLVRQVIESARQTKVEWVHVDFEPHLRPFYERCGFGFTNAGLIKLG